LRPGKAELCVGDGRAGSLRMCVDFSTLIWILFLAVAVQPLLIPSRSPMCSISR
jgi:hypothetical protein